MIYRVLSSGVCRQTGDSTMVKGEACSIWVKWDLAVVAQTQQWIDQQSKDLGLRLDAVAHACNPSTLGSKETPDHWAGCGGSSL